MTTAVQPDIELAVIVWLGRVGSRVRDLVGVDGQGNARVYTTVPKDAGFPMLRVMLVGGSRRSAVSWSRRPLLQLDAFGGSKSAARRLLETAFAELADAVGEHDDLDITAVVPGVDRYLPDPTFSPPKPRYIGDVTIDCHPTR